MREPPVFGTRGTRQSDKGKAQVTDEYKIKRFACFDYQQYYPGGGWDDFVGSFDTIQEAVATRCCQIVDLKTGLIGSDVEQ